LKTVERMFPIKKKIRKFEKRNGKKMKKRQVEDNGEREGWIQFKRLSEPCPITLDSCTLTGSWGRQQLLTSAPTYWSTLTGVFLTHHRNSILDLPAKMSRIVRGVSKKFGKWYQKTNKTEDTNKLTLLVSKIIAILHKTLLATFIKLLETVSKGLFRNRSQNLCHTFVDCRHVCKTCAFHDALQAGTQKEVHRTPLIWRLRVLIRGVRWVDIGKAIPLQALTGPEGSRRLRLPDFKTIGT
jgi:hypothetical protein